MAGVGRGTWEVSQSKSGKPSTARRWPQVSATEGCAVSTDGATEYVHMSGQLPCGF